MCCAAVNAAAASSGLSLNCCPVALARSQPCAYSSTKSIVAASCLGASPVGSWQVPSSAPGPRHASAVWLAAVASSLEVTAGGGPSGGGGSLLAIAAKY